MSKPPIEDVLSPRPARTDTFHHVCSLSSNNINEQKDFHIIPQRFKKSYHSDDTKAFEYNFTQNTDN